MTWSKTWEIIWAMNSRFDNTESLAAYIRRYASEYLETYQIPFVFKDHTSHPTLSLSGEKEGCCFWSSKIAAQCHQIRPM